MQVIYIAREELKEKYQQYQRNRIHSMCKAIADSTQTQIVSQVLQNGTVRFEIIGHRTKLALKYILEEFCMVCY